MKSKQQIDQLIAGLGDWRGKTLVDIRRTILKADPEIVEQWKWMGSLCWYRDGLICVAGVLKNKIKITFSNGASLSDPDKLFNNGLEGKKWRSIDIQKNDKINERSLTSLIHSAIAHNLVKKTKI